jgi:hypothetical protein
MHIGFGGLEIGHEMARLIGALFQQALIALGVPCPSHRVPKTVPRPSNSTSSSGWTTVIDIPFHKFKAIYSLGNLSHHTSRTVMKRPLRRYQRIRMPINHMHSHRRTRYCHIPPPSNNLTASQYTPHGDDTCSSGSSHSSLCALSWGLRYSRGMQLVVITLIHDFYSMTLERQF